MTPVLFDIAKNELGALAALHQSSFAQAWDCAAIEKLLAGPGVFVFFNPDGFVMARVAAGEAEILTLAVAPAARGRGVGRSLLRAAITHAAKLGAEVTFLEVGVDNPAALALYAGLGFARVGQRKGYYDGSDAWVLRLPLPLSGDFA